MSNLDSLAKADAARMACAAVKRDLNAGRITLLDALYDSRSASCRVGHLVKAQHHWGRERTVCLLDRVGVSERRRVADLTNRQRSKLAALAPQVYRGVARSA